MFAGGRIIAVKRDMELVRLILLELEKEPYSQGPIELEIPGRTQDQISYHVMLLHEAGLINATDLSTFAGPDWKPTRLTWQGHEFLDASRDEGRWQKALNIMKDKAGVIAFDVLKELLIQLMRNSVFGT